MPPAGEIVNEQLDNNSIDSEGVNPLCEDDSTESENNSTLSENGSTDSENDSTKSEIESTESVNGIIKESELVIVILSRKVLVPATKKMLKRMLAEIKTIVGDRSLSEDSLLAKRQFLLEDIDVGMATRKLLQLISTNLDLPYKRLGLAGYYTIDTKMRSSKHKAAVIKYLFYDTEENQLLETFCHVKNDSKVDAMKKYIASVTRQKYIFCESAFELDGDKIEEIEEKTPLVYAQLRKLRMSTSMNKRDVSRSGKQTILNTTQLKEALIKEWFSTAMRNTRNNKEKVPLIVLWPLVYYDPEQIQYFEELRLLSATFDDFPVYLVSTRNHHPLTYEGQICREATLRDMSL